MAAQASASSIDTSTHSDAGTATSNSDALQFRDHSTSPDPLRPAVFYPRNLLLFLSKSPLVGPPDDIPTFGEWFGEWFEPQKREADPGLAARPRYRRDADEPPEPPPRESTSRPIRATFSQATQMGSFRHQSSVQSLKLDTGAPDKDRDRDRDPHERLRNLSDRYDRDRDRDRLRSAASDLTSLAIASPSSTTRRDRDAAPHLNATNRQTSSTSLNNTTARRDTRLSERELSSRSNGSATRPTHERTSTLTPKEISEARNDRSDDWRRGGGGDRWEDRERSDKALRERQTDSRRSPSRGWDPSFRDDKDRNDKQRSRSREPRTDDKRGWETRDKDRDPWYRAPNGRADDDRDRRKEEEAPIVPLRSTRREREAEKDRKKDREPAWMDDWAPDSASPSFGKGMPNGEMDKLQAWKKTMKEKDAAMTANSPDDLHVDAKTLVPAQPPATTNDLEGSNNWDEREKSDGEWELVRKSEPKAAAPNGSLSNGAPPGLQNPPASHDLAVISQQSARLPPPDRSILVVSNGVKSSAPTTDGIIDGRSISSQSLGLPAPTADIQDKSFASSPPQSQESASIFQALFNTNPPKVEPATAQAPANDQGLVRSQSSIDSKPTAQNVFASFLNDSRPKANGTSTNLVKSPGADSTDFTTPPPPATTTNSRSNPMPLNLGASANAGGRTSKFAKFFQNPPTPKDETSSHSSMNSVTGMMSQGNSSAQMHQHQSQMSLGGNRDPMSLTSMGGMSMGSSNAFGPSAGQSNMNMSMGVNGMMGVGPGMGMGGRIASPTQHVSAQQQHNMMGGAPPRLGGGADSLAGLFANAERANAGLGGPAAPTGGTMEGFLAALDASARSGQPPSRSGSRFQQQQINKPGNGSYNLQGPQIPGLPSQYAQQQPGGISGLPPQQLFSPGLGDLGDGGRFVADNLVPGLRPQRTRESSLSLGGQGMYGPEIDERELSRQLQNMHFNGMPPQALPSSQHQQIFDQRQHQHQLARQQQQQQQQQTLYANQGQPQQQQQQQQQQQAANRAALAGMMGMAGMGRPGGGPTPSPIANQNPIRTPRELMGMGIGIPGMGGMGGMRSPQDLGMRQQDLGGMGGLGQVRTPQELVHAGLLRGGSAGLPGDMNGPPFQQQQQFAGGRPNPAFGVAGGPGVGVPNVGAPGTADYALHSQQLQAARASAAAQQQAQMMHNLGIRPPQRGMDQQQQQQRAMLPPPHMMGLPNGMGGPMMGADYGPPPMVGGGHMHGSGGGGVNQNTEQFLQLFLGGSGSGLGGGGGGAREMQ